MYFYNNLKFQTSYVLLYITQKISISNFLSYYIIYFNNDFLYNFLQHITGSCMCNLKCNKSNKIIEYVNTAYGSKL